MISLEGGGNLRSQHLRSHSMDANTFATAHPVNIITLAFFYYYYCYCLNVRYCRSSVESSSNPIVLRDQSD